MALFPLFVLFVVVALVVAFPLFIARVARDIVVRRFQMWHLPRVLHRVGRVATWADVEREAAAGPGTIIVSHTSPGWNELDVWWLNESMAAIVEREGLVLATGSRAFDVVDPPNAFDDAGESPAAEAYEARVKNRDFDRWCSWRLINRHRGVAKLIECSSGQKPCHNSLARIELFKAAHPHVVSVRVLPWL